MDILDQLEVIDGFFEDSRFIMRGIGGHAVYGAYKSDGLRSMARLIHDREPFSFTIDQNRFFRLPVEINVQFKRELHLIADALDKGNY